MRWCRTSGPVGRVLIAIGALAIVLTGAVRGQEPARSESPESNPIGDLTTRYHLVETYSTAADQARNRESPGAVGQYQIAIRDTRKMVADKPQGAPDRKETTVQVIYSERAAAVGVTGAVTAAVRRYERFRISPDPARLSDAPPLEGLEIWYQHQPGEEPMILSLFQSRRLREIEVGFAARQVFVPDLSAVLPTAPTRVGDRWPVRKPAQRPLLGERASRAELFATISQVRKGEKTPEAVIDVSGTASLPTGEAALNARLIFTFAEKPNAITIQRFVGGQVLVDAPGAITELRLAMSSTAPMPGGGRLKFTTTRELVLARKLGTNDNPLKIPDPPPTPDEKNSWVTYDDPKGRFHFRHPQDLRMMPPRDEFSIVLVRERRPDADLVFLQLQPKTGDAETDQRNRNPDFYHETLKERWRLDKIDALPGKAGWLPEADWAGAKMKVYRIETSVRPVGAATKGARRTHCDNYLVLFGQNESLTVEAMTAQENPAAFRKQVESLLKTFQFESATPSR